jgi:hypothetical protein
LTPDVVEVDKTRPVPPNQVLLLDDIADVLWLVRVKNEWLTGINNCRTKLIRIFAISTNLFVCVSVILTYNLKNIRWILLESLLGRRPSCRIPLK